MSYVVQRNWADNFLDLQKQIITKYKSRLDFSKSEKLNAFKYDTQKDYNENTDLVMYQYNKLNIALRVRNIENCKYRDLTIRSYKNGNRTEIDKLLDGYGDYMLYSWGFIDTIPRITEFILIDLDIFRKNHNKFYIDRKDNYDGSSFNVYCCNKIIKTDCAVAVYLK